jgi:hypothetical protein
MSVNSSSVDEVLGKARPRVKALSTAWSPTRFLLQPCFSCITFYMNRIDYSQLISTTSRTAFEEGVSLVAKNPIEDFQVSPHIINGIDKNDRRMESGSHCERRGSSTAGASQNHLSNCFECVSHRRISYQRDCRNYNCFFLLSYRIIK